MSKATDSGVPTEFFGHPAGLKWLFAMEACERFSYYGMRAILLYFIIDTSAHGGLALSKASGQALVAVYGASAYFLSILGGVLADRFVGPYRSTLYGGVIVLTGHLLLILPVEAASWTGICCVAVGTGLLKPNVQTMAGTLYRDGDLRRDGGFQLLYMSVNIGAFCAAFIVGMLRAAGGYHAGFAAAAVVMALSLLVFLIGRSSMPVEAMHPTQRLARHQRTKLAAGSAGAVTVTVAVFLLFLMFSRNTPDAVIGTVSVLSAAAALGYFAVLFRSRSVTPFERRNVRAYLPLWFAALLVWMIEEQAAVKMATFAASHTDLRIGGFHIPPEWYQSINPAVIVLFAPFLAAWFTTRAGKFPGLAHKFVFGTGVTALSALLMGLAFQRWPAGGSLAPWWVLLAVFVIQTVGVMFISPVGAAATTMLMPKAFKAQGMAVWLLNNAVAQGVAAAVIRYMDELSDADFYYWLTAITAALTFVLMLYSPSITRRMRDLAQNHHSTDASQNQLVVGGTK
ncbi:peptide MFS transporter [Streptomyces malaysiensis]|uniref:peptide MFS transporter n=1 Tax=Streptomyces malaysiensis TaxID=92644 RepID=UPI0037216E4A